MKQVNKIIHGGDYNPDQWIKTPEIWDEDIRLMKEAHINSATVGIFAWSLYEPEEGKYNFEWLDTIIDKIYDNGIDVVLSTPSGARPAWMAMKYPEVLRVEENGIRNEFGVRHNHCLTSPVYREKVRGINRILAERYGKHPGVKLWHISNEYSGECHCELCRNAFIEWLKNYYHNSLDELNDSWWNGFWSHYLTDWNQISTPKSRGENHSSAMKLCWNRFVSDSHISFYENEIAPLRELSPDIPITTNFMRMYDGIDYQEFAKHVDIVSWDNYPYWDEGKSAENIAIGTAFVHDTFRSMKDGMPFLMMESTPSIANWHTVNKIPKEGRQALSSMQALAFGADSVQYFQWRKARGGHEKFHGAVVDHCGHSNTRVFRDISKLGVDLEKLFGLVGKETESKVAIVYDWQNSWAIKHYCGYNNPHREYYDECVKWYKPFLEKGIPVDIIPMDADYSKYDLIIAPYLYMLKDGTEDRIENYVNNGGKFIGTYLTGIVDKDDLCYLGGFPAGKLKDVFGVWCEETDSIPEGLEGLAEYNGKEYEINHICDIIHSDNATILGEYKSDFYCGMPCVTKNNYGSGTAYYVAFRNDSDFTDDFCKDLIEEIGLKSQTDISAPKGIHIRQRGEYICILNFSDENTSVELDKEYYDVINDTIVSGKIDIPVCGYCIIK